MLVSLVLGIWLAAGFAFGIPLGRHLQRRVIHRPPAGLATGGGCHG